MRLARLVVCFFLPSLAAMGGTALPGVDEAKCIAAASLAGPWEAPQGGSQLLFSDEQIVIRRGDSLRVAKILRREPCRLTVRDQGIRSTWQITLDEGLLHIEGGEVLALRRLSTVPPELDVSLPSLPAPRPIPPDQAKAAADELLSRARKDQAALKDPALKATRRAILADNLRYLRALTLEVGWIDIPRFGKEAAAAALLIAKHGSDLHLMEAALPIVEKDVKEHGGSGEMYSVLYDELAIVLGNRQRYGTQVMEDAAGRPYVLPVEDPSMVDAFRKEIGILSWQDYLKLLSENLYGGTPIQPSNDPD